MPTLEVAQYEPSLAEAWDELVAEAPMATLLHTRRFLGYHGDRFDDASLVVHNGRRLAGVLPAAIDPRRSRTVTSHPGATFGGLVHRGDLMGPAMLEALEQAAGHFRRRGFACLRYSPVPSIYHRRPSADDAYALFRLRARLVRRDLSCAVDLFDAPGLSARRQRGLKRAQRARVELADGAELLDELWPIIERNLAERHGASPVHSLDEMRLLASLFPDEITTVVARCGSQAIAGVVLFDSVLVSHAQYIASTAEGNDLSALDLVFAHCFDRARERRARFFDFGTSNREEGWVLNEGLYRFKTEFGGGGAAYDQYELCLEVE